jgi:hypothetical protein
MNNTESLRVDPRLASPDDFYQALMDMHRDLDEAQSRLVNAKLILLLANHVGDQAVLDEAMRIAREGVAGPVPDTAGPKPTK